MVGMIAYDEAVALLCAAAGPLGAEEVPLAEAHRRVLARPVVARLTAPRHAVAIMDGYAVRSADLAAGTPIRISGESLPGGGLPAPLPRGTAARVFTGAAIPPGADRVVMQEQARLTDDGVTIDPVPDAPAFIRPAGADFAIADTLLAAGTLLGPAQLVAAAAGDVASVSVALRPRIALHVLGDELVAPGEAASLPAAVPDSVSLAVTALAAAWGGIVVKTQRLPDDLPACERAAAAALSDADLVVVTGGASVGARDYAKEMFAPAGLDLVFSKVAMKPGKPVWAGRAASGLVLGLPGNPGSALVTARLFLAPLLCALTGRDPRAALAWRASPLAAPLAATGDRESFDRATLLTDGTIHPIASRDSGAQAAFAAAALLLRRPANAPALAAGATVPVLTL